MQFDAKQREAIDLCLDPKNRIVAITGEAGTGKTKIMEEIYESLHRSGVSVVATSPTGKGARRIKEATGIDAITNHRLLEYPKPKERDENGDALIPGVPKRNRSRPIDFQVVLADEYAMQNDEIHRNLIAALPPGGRICMFGDANQLRPVENNKSLQGEPSNFERILADKRFKSVKLETLHRTDESSIIARNGRRILMGMPPLKADNYNMTVTDKPVESLLQLVGKQKEIWGTLKSQIVVPSRMSWIGTDKINAALQQHVFQRDVDYRKGFWLPRHKWAKAQVNLYIGDKIIFTQNNYDLNLFNGEVGIVLDIAPCGDVTADFGDREVIIPYHQTVTISKNQQVTICPLKDIELAYAITTHKTQGSEYSHILYLMNKSVSFLCNRRNFYTAETRARESVTVITDNVALSKSLNDKGDR